MYDTFSSDYDRFVNWTNRLDFEIPFIERNLQAVRSGDRPARVLDAACGTGMHAIALAKKGYHSAGADISSGMVMQARMNAAEAGLEIHFVQAGFGATAPAFRLENAGLLPFDALLCLGNSLPHLLAPADLHAALADFAACLRPGGLLLIQNRNFDAVMKQRERWMEPQSQRESGPGGGTEWLFLRFYDYLPDGLIQFNIVTLSRAGQASWQQRETSTLLYPLMQSELVVSLEKAGFDQVTCYGGMDGAPYSLEKSENLVVTAYRKGGNG